MDNVLDVLDQRTFDVAQALGINSLLQCVWIYNRPIDVDGLRRFHHHLEHGRLARRIERSPLPFGRHRWVATEGPSEIEFVPTPRPRTDLEDWLDEQVHIPLDPELGPGLHLAVLPFTDGGYAISLIVSHSLVDGVGLCLALTEAALGRDSSIDWPPPASRGRWQALRQDIVQTARDVPTMIRAVTTVLRTARKAGTGGGSAQPSRSATVEVIDDDEGSIAPVPMATMFVDAAQWEARAQELGGTNNSLLVGVAARLAKRVGRLTADGRVVVGLPVNQRVEGDTRANARTNVTVTVDPDLATTDLRDIRAAVKQALIHLQEHPAETHAIDPLIPVLPKRLLRAGSRTDGSSGVGSSNLGVVDDAAGRADGTDADRFSIGVLPHMGITQEMLHRFDGVQTFLSGIAQGRVFITAASSQPGHTGSSEDLRKDLSHALSDFSLTGASF